MTSGTILLVEDNPSDVGLTRRALEKAHIDNDLKVVRDGQEALDYIFGTGEYAGRDVSDVPALTFLDLKLPKVWGLEVLRRIRSGTCTRRMPVVILTSSSQEQDMIVGYDLGANSYVRKPVDFKEFAEVVERTGKYWLALNVTPPKV
jgi:DNA-binding response OmpR family regulator